MYGNQCVCNDAGPAHDSHSTKEFMKHNGNPFIPMILKLPSLPITTNKSLQMIEMLAHLVLPAHPPQPYKSIEPNRFAVIPFFPPAANQAESASSRQQANQHTSQLSQIRQKNNGCDIPPREHRESPREHRESQASQTTLNRSRVCFPLSFIVFLLSPIAFHGISFH